MTHLDPHDLVSRRAYVRVYSGALGHEDQVMAEGWAVWYHDGPMLGVEDTAGQHAWPTRLRIQEIPPPVQDKPRVWAMPEIPEDVKGVEDRNGNTWARIGPSRSWDCTSDKGEYYRPLTSFELLRGRGPLSEVVEPDGD